MRVENYIINNCVSIRYLKNTIIEINNFAHNHVVSEIININDPENVIDAKIRAFWYPPFGAKIVLNSKKYCLVNQEIMDEVAKNYT